ncbi:MAG: peptide-methionine (R)-S-oxide reductase MsrB [Cellvibrionaceae bacterium]
MSDKSVDNHLDNSSVSGETSRVNEDNKPQQDDTFWLDKLTPEQYRICREKGTEAAFTGEYWDTKEEGMYHCRCCGEPLFSSETKYDSGCGWPSFYDSLDHSKVKEEQDTSHGMIRTEITCAKCGCHLGHVFPDGPKPTGVRYCVNSASVNLMKEK